MSCVIINFFLQKNVFVHKMIFNGGQNNTGPQFFILWGVG